VVAPDVGRDDGREITGVLPPPISVGKRLGFGWVFVQSAPKAPCSPTKLIQLTLDAAEAFFALRAGGIFFAFVTGDMFATPASAMGRVL